MKLKLLALLALMFTSSTATLLAQKDHSPERAAHKEARQEVREELKAYRKEVIRPEILKARLSLETELNAEDRAELDRLRKIMKTRPRPDRENKSAERADRKAQREALREKTAQWKEEHAADLQTLDRLVTKYDQEITAAQTKLKALQPEWDAHRKSVMEKHGVDRKEKGERRHHRHPKHRHAAEGQEADDQLSHEERHELHRRRRFLLMNPAKKEDKEAQKAVTVSELPIQMEIFPNPASGKASLGLDLPEETNLRLSVIDENGRTVLSLGRQKFVAGQQNIDLDLSGFKSGRYTVLATNRSGKKSALLIVN
ncbi:hypothetical protein CEQ90_11025 [Lewinellaceae bacterium SD302]|nr:hypothetical protein CEQ90_11025 [Lewinellaceae bacterium SD302]